MTTPHSNRSFTLGTLLAFTLASLGALGCAGCLGCGGRPTVTIDGSSTVLPITSLAVERYTKEGGMAKVTVGVSGTGGGFKKFIAKEIPICNASRPITEDEKKKCEAAGIQYIDFQVGIDGLAVIVNPANDFIDCLTFEQLKKIWDQDSQVKTWKDVDASWPDEKIVLYGPGDQSGTFDYFTEAVNGKSKRSRSDFTQSEDDNILVTGVAGNKYALGYFGYAYYEGNKDKIKLVKLNKSGECVQPSDETVLAGVYPLSRPLFIYVNRGSLKEPGVADFVKYYLNHVSELASKVRYVPPTAETVKANLDKLQAELGK